MIRDVNTNSDGAHSLALVGATYTIRDVNINSASGGHIYD